MRHDKAAFAGQAIQSAQIGKLVGEYIRILHLSAYAQVVSDDMVRLKEDVSPFTGCFISRTPITVVYLRLALKAASFFAMGKDKEGLELINIGAGRIPKVVNLTQGSAGLLKQQYEKERIGWNLYYDVLSHVESALGKEDAFAVDLRRKAQGIIKQCWLDSASSAE
jgi:hypothetical protein